MAAEMTSPLERRLNRLSRFLDLIAAGDSSKEAIVAAQRELTMIREQLAQQPAELSP